MKRTQQETTTIASPVVRKNGPKRRLQQVPSRAAATTTTGGDKIDNTTNRIPQQQQQPLMNLPHCPKGGRIIMPRLDSALTLTEASNSSSSSSSSNTSAAGENEHENDVDLLLLMDQEDHLDLEARDDNVGEKRINNKRLPVVTSPAVKSTRGFLPPAPSIQSYFCSLVRDTNNTKNSNNVAAATAGTTVTAATTTIRIHCDNDKKQQKGSKNALSLRTGIIHEASPGHYDKGHGGGCREKPSRIWSVMEALEKEQTSDGDRGGASLLDQCQNLGNGSSLSNASSDSSCGDDTDANADAAAAFLNDEDYLRVHLPGYMQRLNKLSSLCKNDCSCSLIQHQHQQQHLDQEAMQYQSIFMTDQSTEEAKRAASSLCLLVSKVVQGELDNGFAVIRPPGHHAEPGMAGGYCLINNVAVAARFALSQFSETISKVLIVDWDIHHGNGTQAAFLRDPNVMYFSVHRNGNFYPFLSNKNAGPTTVGVDQATGYNVNVGWTRKGMGDEEYFAVWEKLLMPMAREFQPDLILVSSGFDGAEGDMGECHVTPECFALLTGALMSLAKKGRVVCALEGGYVRSVLQNCVQAVVGALLDPKSPQKYQSCEKNAWEDRQGRDILETIDSSAAKSIRATLQAHTPYWKCLRNMSQEDTSSSSPSE